MSDKRDAAANCIDLLREALQAETAARVKVKAERDRLKQVLNDIYPTIAGHAIRLRNAGEVNATEEWDRISWIVFEATRGEVPARPQPEKGMIYDG